MNGALSRGPQNASTVRKAARQAFSSSSLFRSPPSFSQGPRGAEKWLVAITRKMCGFLESRQGGHQRDDRRNMQQNAFRRKEIRLEGWEGGMRTTTRMFEDEQFASAFAAVERGHIEICTTGAYAWWGTYGFVAWRLLFVEAEICLRLLITRYDLRTGRPREQEIGVRWCTHNCDN